MKQIPQGYTASGDNDGDTADIKAPTTCCSMHFTYIDSLNLKPLPRK